MEKKIKEETKNDILEAEEDYLDNVEMELDYSISITDGAMELGKDNIKEHKKYMRDSHGDMDDEEFLQNMQSVNNEEAFLRRADKRLEVYTHQKKVPYFGKIVLLLARTLNMSRTVSDCDTKHLVCYDIKSKNHLKKLNGKFFKYELDDFDYQVVNSKKDEDLIGKKIYVRSAATCALGDCVCARCVGLTSSTNYDISDGLSAFESEEVTKVVEQSILSTKHLLTTNSEAITFNEEFYKFFTIIGGEINPLINDNIDVEDIENYAIYINPDDLVKMDEQDYDGMYNTCISNGRFYIRNIEDKKAEDIEIKCEGDKEIFLTDDALEFMKAGKGLIYFKDIDDDVKLFEMVILNKELTKPLYDLMNLLNKLNTDEIVETIDTISQKFLDLLIESKIDANSIASELIINRLIRSCEHQYDRPDFTKEKLEPYNIYTVSKALERNKSPLIGISFQNIKRQFLSDELYEERDGESFIDAFYQKEIPTTNLKKYAEIVKQIDSDKYE